MNLKNRIWYAIQDRRRNKFVARITQLCRDIHRASEHAGRNLKHNGEKELLAQSVTSGGHPVLFDVGANLGEWTAVAHDVFPTATIHSFELSPDTSQGLAQRFSGNPQIRVHRYGLAATSGTVNFHAYGDEASSLNSLRAAIYSHVAHTIKTAVVRTGAEVCSEFGIRSIDFLKIDAEGSDFEVLLGFREMLASQRVAAIQFEHTGGRYLRDFYDLLCPLGYSIGKLYSKYVDFTEHHNRLEYSLGPNYVAIPNSRKELLGSLKSGW